MVGGLSAVMLLGHLQESDAGSSSACDDRRRVIEIWQIDRDQPAAVVESLAATLSTEERERAARAALERIRERAIVTRAAVRAILAGYVDCPPADLRFRAGARGKPELSHPEDGPSFNLSHSGGFALLAVAGERAVGIDVERVGRRVRWRALADRYFTAGEAAAVRDERSFLIAWTCKEAYLKALGEGLQRGLDSFEVSVDGPAALLGEPGWTLCDVDVPAPYVAALAVEGEPGELRLRRWAPIVNVRESSL